MMEAVEYTFSEITDVHFFYGLANGNAHEARRLYQETFPNRGLPCSRTFSRIPQSLRERGTFVPVLEGGSHRTARTVKQEQRILLHVASNPGISTRRISSAEGVHRSTLWRLLHEVRLYSYHLQRVQDLKIRYAVYRCSSSFRFRSYWFCGVGCWLWLSEVRRPVREEVTRLLVCFTQQGQRERWVVKTASAVPAQAATNRSGV